MHFRLRLSCWLPSQSACWLRLWQLWHCWLATSAETRASWIGFTFDGSLACASPGPWHDSQPCWAAGVRALAANPCFVAATVWS